MYTDYDMFEEPEVIKDNDEFGLFCECCGYYTILEMHQSFNFKKVSIKGKVATKGDEESQIVPFITTPYYQELPLYGITCPCCSIPLRVFKMRFMNYIPYLIQHKYRIEEAHLCGQGYVRLEHEGTDYLKKTIIKPAVYFGDLSMRRTLRLLDAVRYALKKRKEHAKENLTLLAVNVILGFESFYEEENSVFRVLKSIKDINLYKVQDCDQLCISCILKYGVDLSKEGVIEKVNEEFLRYLSDIVDHLKVLEVEDREVKEGKFNLDSNF